MKRIFGDGMGPGFAAGALGILLAIFSSAGHAYDQSQDSPHGGVATVGEAQPYRFKIAYLGMSLSDFKKAASGEPYMAEVGMKRSLFGRHRPVMEELATPLCSDSGGERVLSGLSKLSEGEVYCDASPGDTNVQMRTVAGTQAIKVFYLFYKNRLYCISLDALPQQFEVIEGAFTAKYGKPTRLGDDVHQNGYGAKVAVRKFLWKRGEQMILLKEGLSSDSGMLSSATNAVFLDPLLAPPGAAPVIDF